RSGTFVSRMGLSFRYHVMFRELLRSQLRHRMPDAFFLQHRRAARWYAQNGRGAMAVRHSIQAQDWDVAAGLITANWVRWLVAGEALAVRSLITSLPRQTIVRDPELA